MTATSAFNLDEIEWSEPKVIPTRTGDKQIRTWVIEPQTNPAFWDLWRTGQLRAAGHSIRKVKGIWELTEWRAADGSQSERSARVTEEIKAAKDGAPAELSDKLESAFREIAATWPAEYDYQLPHIRALLATMSAHKTGVDASDTGTGKTACALAVAKVLGLRPFVLTPLSVIPDWLSMAEAIGVEPIDVLNYERLRAGTEYGDWTMKRVKRRDPKTKEMVEKIVKHRFVWHEPVLEIAKTLVVLDECHRCKDPSSLNSKMAVAALEAGYHTMLLSATAADNPLHMIVIALATRMIRRAQDFYGWLKYQGVKKGRYGLFFVGGRKVLTRLHHRIFPLYGSRMRISELGDRFPETKIISAAYRMDDAAEIQKAYDLMHAEIAKLEEKAAHDKEACILTAKLRARQRAEILKVPTFVQMADDGIEGGSSVAIFVNFQETLTALSLRLQTSCVIHGEQSGSEGGKIRRRENIDAFNADSEHLIVCNSQAGGVGIGLQGKVGGRPRLTLISPTFSGQDLKQVLGRAPRGGGCPSIQKIVFAEGTEEENAAVKVKAKIARINIINDGELDEALSF